MFGILAAAFLEVDKVCGDVNALLLAIISRERRTNVFCSRRGCCPALEHVIFIMRSCDDCLPVLRFSLPSVVVCYS